MPFPAGRKMPHPASAGGQPVCAGAWTTAQTGTHKRQNLGAETGVDFLYSAPCSHKTGMANWQAPLPWWFCPGFSNTVMPSWGGASALYYQMSPSLWNDAAESNGLEIRWTLKHGVFHCMYGHSLKQVDFSRSGVRRVLVRFYWLGLCFPLCIFYSSPTPPSQIYKPSASSWDRPANREMSQFAQYLPGTESCSRHFWLSSEAESKKNAAIFQSLLEEPVILCCNDMCI